MALQNLDGGLTILIGSSVFVRRTSPTASATTLDAANEALICIGRIVTSDGGSHTIDTTGSSSIGWRSSAVTFANAGTTVKIGIAAVNTAAGPPARAAHVADVITFDVNAAHVGGGGGMSANSWITSVPTAGTSTIAHGDLIAVCVQMTARAGVDSVAVVYGVVTDGLHRPTLTSFTGGSYAVATGLPDVFITFSDGATGFFQSSDIFSVIATRTWNSGGATKEYGQLMKLPFPCKIYGAYWHASPDANFDVVLYSDPLGTPVAEKTVSIDLNVTASATGRFFTELFSSPYTTAADQDVGIVLKPGGSNISAYYKTLANAGHRVADTWGVDGYGISRASGAFSNANSSLDHYYIGLIIGAFDDGAGAGAAGGISRARAAAGF
jgi:hypothetical protein